MKSEMLNGLTERPFSFLLNSEAINPRLHQQGAAPPFKSKYMKNHKTNKNPRMKSHDLQTWPFRDRELPADNNAVVLCYRISLLSRICRDLIPTFTVNNSFNINMLLSQFPDLLTCVAATVSFWNKCCHT